MSKGLEALEKLSLLEKWKNFLDFVDVPTKARLLNADYKEGLEQYRYLRTEIETALKDIDEIMSNHNCSNLSELNEKLCDYEELKVDYENIAKALLKALEILEILKDNLFIEEGTGRFKGLKVVNCSLGNQHSGSDFEKVEAWLNRQKIA